MFGHLKGLARDLWSGLGHGRRTDESASTAEVASESGLPPVGEAPDASGQPMPRASLTPQEGLGPGWES